VTLKQCLISELKTIDLDTLCDFRT